MDHRARPPPWSRRSRSYCIPGTAKIAADRSVHFVLIAGEAEPERPPEMTATYEHGPDPFTDGVRYPLDGNSQVADGKEDGSVLGMPPVIPDGVGRPQWDGTEPESCNRGRKNGSPRPVGYRKPRRSWRLKSSNISSSWTVTTTRSSFVPPWM